MRCHLVGKWSHIGPSLPTGVWGRVLHCWLAKRFPAVMTRRDASFVRHISRTHTLTHSDCVLVFYCLGSELSSDNNLFQSSAVYKRETLRCAHRGSSLVCLFVSELMWGMNERQRDEDILAKAVWFSPMQQLWQNRSTAESEEIFIGFDACLLLPRPANMAKTLKINLYLRLKVPLKT